VKLSWRAHVKGDRNLFQRAIDSGELCIQVRSETINHRDNGQRDTGCDQAILNCGEGSLFVSVNCALDGYAASRISSCFGYSDGIMSVYRELLVSTLVLTQQKVPEARFVYRYDGDISKLLDVARPLAEYILSFSANLVGHADGLTDVQVMTVVTGADPT
jgi:hypothetical protein